MGQRGQATVEYLAVALAVAAVLASVSLLFAGVPVGEAVVRQMARAICVVGGGDCYEDRAPCVVSSHREGTSKHVNVIVFRIGRDEAVLREGRSDGTVAITRIRDVSAGLELGVGSDAHASLGGRSLLVGSMLRAAVLAHRGGGSTWVLPDRDAADRLVARIRGGATGSSLPEPGEVSSDTAFSVTLAADRGIGPAEATLTLGSSDFFGSRVDRLTGRRTAFVRRRNEMSAAVMLAGGAVKGAARGAADAGGLAGVAGDAAHDELYAVTVDRNGRLVDLAIVVAGSYHAAADLPPGLEEIVGKLDVPTEGGRLYETETHLDLTDPLNLAAARDFLEQVRSPAPHSGRVVQVSTALGKRIDAAGVVQARTYALTGSSAGVGGHVAWGAKVGGEYEHTTQSARLVDAMSRGPGGVWTRRGDCVERA